MKTLMMTAMVAGCGLAVQALAAGCCAADKTTCTADKGKALCPAGACLADKATAPEAKTAVTKPVTKEAAINTEALASMLRAKVPLTALDARSGKYDDGRRVPGAKALSPTAKEEEVTALLPDKKALIVTYCAGLKCPASHMLSEKLRGMGYENVLEYQEGVEGWVAAGNAVEQATAAKGKE